MKFKTFHYMDNAVLKCEAFSMLVPEDWVVSGGIIWRQHATMPGAISLSITSPDGLYDLSLFPSMPYFWKGNSLSFFGPKEGSYYMGNEIRRPVGFVQYLQQYVLPISKFKTRILSTRKFPEIENALRMENPGGYGFTTNFDCGAAKIEYDNNGYLFEGDITCGIVTSSMMFGQTSWIADKIIATRAPKGRLEEASKIFTIMLQSFKFDLKWFNLYHQYVQSLTQYVLQDIYNAGVISKIISSTFDYVSDTVRSSYEAQQASNERVFRGISESIRGVNSYYDPFKGRNIEIPNSYKYVYANSLGEYIVTDDPSYNPNQYSNLNWTILNRR